MTDRMSDSIRERQYGQYLRNYLLAEHLILSQPVTIVTIGKIITVVQNNHNWSKLSQMV